jgi:flagellar protein FliL
MAKSKDEESKDGDAKDGGGKKKLIIIAVPLLLVVLAAAYFLVLKPKAAPAPAAGAAAAAPAPTPTTSFAEGAVVKSDPISINLAGGHYLKVGMALQASKTAGEDVSPAKALDAAIALFSNKSIDELSTLAGREKAKAKLVDHLREIYEGKVYDVYFTEFVMQ